jgi:hypothetical protein
MFDMETKSNPLMLIATLGTFLLLGLLIFFPIPDANAQIFLATSSFVLGFYFGSSVNKPRPNTERKGDLPDDSTITAEKVVINTPPATVLPEP